MDDLEKPRRLKLVPDPALHGAGGVSFEPLKFKNAGEAEECPVSPASQGQQIFYYNTHALKGRGGDIGHGVLASLAGVILLYMSLSRA